MLPGSNKTRHFIVNHIGNTFTSATRTRVDILHALVDGRLSCSALDERDRARLRPHPDHAQQHLSIC